MYWNFRKNIGRVKMEKYKVLVLDDDKIVAESFKDRLEQIGIYDVTAMFDPNNALEHVKRNGFDAFLIDQKMPGMTGEQFIRKLINYVPAPLIYVISAVDDDAMIAAARKEIEDGGLPIKKYIDKLESNKDYVFSVDLKEDLREHRLKEKILQVIGVDFSENRKIEHELATARERIFEMKKRDAAMIGALTVISAINHELNNLNAIFDSKATLLEYLYEDISGKVEEKYLQKIKDIKEGIESTSHRFNANIRFMKTLMSTDNHDRKKEHEMEKLIDTSLAFLKEDIEKKNITVTKNYTPGLKVNASVELLQHAFYQIVKNSVEAIIKPGGRIEITTALDAENAMVSIVDDGKGIAEEDLDKVYIPFYNRGKIYGGKGGSIAHKIFVMNHLGTVAIENLNGTRPGPNGMKTQVRITLPGGRIK